MRFSQNRKKLLRKIFFHADDIQLLLGILPVCISKRYSYKTKNPFSRLSPDPRGRGEYPKYPSMSG